MGTMRSPSNEIVEMLSRKLTDICCLQESRWKGKSARKIAGRNSSYKFFWKEDDSGSGCVGVLVAGKWVDNVISVVRHSTRLIMLRLLCGKSIINFACVYAPQPGLFAEEKDRFHEQLLVLVTSVASSETLVIAGDFNSHVGQHSQGFSQHHSGYGYGAWNQERMRILDLCAATDLAVTNTFFRKRNSQLVTYNSGGCTTQVDYIPVRRTELKLVKNANVIENEECIPQLKLLAAVLKIQTPSEKLRFIAAKRKLWRLRQPEVQAEYQNSIKKRRADVTPSCIEDAWKNLKDCLLSGMDKVCGKTKSGRVHHTETWWSNDAVNVVKKKRHKWKQWKLGGSNEEYQLAKKAARRAEYDAKQ